MAQAYLNIIIKRASYAYIQVMQKFLILDLVDTETKGNREGEWLRIRKLLESIQLETDGLTLPSNIIEDFKKNGPNVLQLGRLLANQLRSKSRINIISMNGLLLAEMIFL